MFERYTERAKSDYLSSRRGCTSQAQSYWTEHLLLGLLRERKASQLRY